MHTMVLPWMKNRLKKVDICLVFAFFHATGVP